MILCQLYREMRKVRTKNYLLDVIVWVEIIYDLVKSSFIRRRGRKELEKTLILTGFLKDKILYRSINLFVS